MITFEISYMENIFEEFYPDSEIKKTVILKELQQKEFSDYELILSEKSVDVLKYFIIALLLLLFSIFPFFIQIESPNTLDKIYSFWLRIGALFFGVLLGVNSIIKLINAKKRRKLTVSETGIAYTDYYGERSEYIHKEDIKQSVIKLFGNNDDIRAFLLILKTNDKLISIEITDLKSKEHSVFTDKEWTIWWSGKFPDHIKLRSLLGKFKTSE